MNKLLWLCGIIAFAVVSCTEGNRDSIKEKDTLSTYDSVLIGRDPGFSRHLTEDYWMLYKDGIVQNVRDQYLFLTMVKTLSELFVLVTPMVVECNILLTIYTSRVLQRTLWL